MTRDDIIRMARKAGWEKARSFDDCPACGVFDLERFAAIVAAAEREACADVCEGHYDTAQAAQVIRAKGSSSQQV